MRPIDADALMDDIKRDSKKAIDDGDKVGSFWLGYAAGLVIKQPTIQPEKAQAAIDIGRNATVDTNPSHFEAHQKFTQFMDDAEVSSFGRWQWANGFNTALTAVGIDLKKLPTVQPEPKEGQWIPHESPDGGMQYECSECGVLWEFNDGTPEDNEAYFCPKCGTKMKGAKHETD